MTPDAASERGADGLIALITAYSEGMEREAQRIAAELVPDHEALATAFGFAVAMLMDESKRAPGGAAAWRARQRRLLDGCLGRG